MFIGISPNQYFLYDKFLRFHHDHCSNWIASASRDDLGHTSKFIMDVRALGMSFAYA